MGNSDTCCNREIESKSNNDILIEYIHKRTAKSFKMFLSALREQDLKKLLQSKFEAIKGHTNVLGYCFIKNKYKHVKMLLAYSWLFIEMEKEFRSQNFELLIYLARRDYCKCVKALILQTNWKNRRSSVYSAKTLDFCKGVKDEDEYYDLPVIEAVKYGALNTVKFFYDQFSKLNEVPEEFDVNSKDGSYGENCALVACRSGNFEMVSFLHTYCNANFHELNKSNESAIIICLSRIGPELNDEYFKILRYLIENLQLNLKDCCEEALIISQNSKITSYLEDRLKMQGVDIKKQDIEKNYSNKIKFTNKPTKSELDRILTDSFLKSLNQDRNPSYISSIEPQDEQEHRESKLSCISSLLTQNDTTDLSIKPKDS